MNAFEVLNTVDSMLMDGEMFKEMRGRSKKWQVREVYRELGIFDWWRDDLSMSNLREMRKFLVTAISLGYGGYVCFKVGAAGCSHGMWAHRLESDTGYSPSEGGCLYHSFRAGDNYWGVRLNDGTWDERWDMTLAQVKEVLAAAGEVL